MVLNHREWIVAHCVASFIFSTATQLLFYSYIICDSTVASWPVCLCIAIFARNTVPPKNVCDWPIVIFITTCSCWHNIYWRPHQVVAISSEYFKGIVPLFISLFLEYHHVSEKYAYSVPSPNLLSVFLNRCTC